MKIKRCVLFMWRVPDLDRGMTGMLIEQLRYAGLLKIVKESRDEDGSNFVLEIRAPHGLDANVWAAQNAERMRSFGINAQDPPESSQ